MTIWLPLKYVSGGVGNVSGEKDSARPFGCGGVLTVCLISRGCIGGIAPCDLGGTRLGIGFGAGSRANVGNGGGRGRFCRVCVVSWT